MAYPEIRSTHCDGLDCSSVTARHVRTVLLCHDCRQNAEALSSLRSPLLLRLLEGQTLPDGVQTGLKPELSENRRTGEPAPCGSSCQRPATAGSATVAGATGTPQSVLQRSFHHSRQQEAPCRAASAAPPGSLPLRTAPNAGLPWCPCPLQACKHSYKKRCKAAHVPAGRHTCSRPATSAM